LQNVIRNDIVQDDIYVFQCHVFIKDSPMKS
jgi:hypothetical protein